MVDQHADSCFVKLSNCGSASESDIKSFLQGIDIEACGANDAGSVLIKCTSAKGAQAALAFDQKELSGNAVTLRRQPADSSLGEAKEQAALRL